jgi:prolyl 4-hydroxylase
MESLEKHRVPTDLVQIYYVPNFIATQIWLDQLIDLIDANCQPSTVTVGSKRESTDYRTSSTCYLQTDGNRAVSALQDRILETLGLPLAQSEPIQGQRYRPGQYFKEHRDYFAPGTDTYKEFAKDGNQRTWTFMMYLNTVNGGGYTAFPALNLQFKPKPGYALIWNNLDAAEQENPNTNHFAVAPENGSKYIITQWFRKFDYR